MKNKYIGMMLGALVLSFASQAMVLQNASPEEQFECAMRCLKGNETQRDVTKALQLLHLSAEGGNARAQNSLGFHYMYGLDVEEDALEAVRFYGLAAAQGDASAQNNLGWMYENGNGVTQDLEEAVRLYKGAAVKGLALAQRHLGDMYLNGKDVPQNFEEAFRYYHMAAFPGVAFEDAPGVVEGFKKHSRRFRVEAQVSLGGMHYFGVGVAEDSKEAARLYELAAACGHPHAAHMLVLLGATNKK